MMLLWIACGIMLFYACGSLALALLFFVQLRIPDERSAARATLVLPLTGAAPNLDELLAALSRQSLRPRRLIVAVESREDPAYRRVKAVAGVYRDLEIELVVAGLSSGCGQKCANLLAALACLDDDDDCVVLFDADIRPQSWWLAALVAPLAAGRADIVNGYRWQVPQTRSLAAALVATIDRTIATLPRVPLTHALWGGSLALNRRAIAALDLPATIGRVLTEDLTIGARAAQIGLRVLTRRAVRAPTPVEGGFGRLWRFGRRQYQLIRLYCPGLWSYAAAVETSDLAARLTVVYGLTAGATQGLALSSLLAVGLLGSIATALRQLIGRRLATPDSIAVRLFQHLLVWSIVPLPAFHSSVVWGGFVASPVRWAHVDYAVDRRGRVTRATRRSDFDQSP